MLTFPLLLVLVLSWLTLGAADSVQLQGALRGMGAMAAGMIAATGFKLFPALKLNVLGALVCFALVAITFVLIALLRVPLIWVLLGLGSVTSVWANRLLVQTRGARTP